MAPGPFSARMAGLEQGAAISDGERFRKTRLEISEALRDVAWGRSPWFDVCALLAESLPGSAPSIVNYDLETAAVHSAFAVGIDPSYQASYKSYYASLNPWLEFWRKAPAGEVSISERDAPSRSFADSEFHADWLKPQGNMEAAVGMRIDVGVGEVIHIAWHYGLSRAGAYDAPAAAMLEELRPDFARAIRDAGLIRNAVQAGGPLRSLLEHVDGAAFLVDRDRNIRDANQLGERSLRRGGVLQATGYVLAARDCAVQQWLEDVVMRLVDREPVVSTSHVFASGGASGGRVFRFIVSRLPDQYAAPTPLLISPRPLVLVVLQLLAGGRLSMDHAALKVAFGLSAAEIRLCEALVNGKSLAAAAGMLGLSDGTVRQRVKMIFHKTHTHRQGELIAALSRFATAE